MSDGSMDDGEADPIVVLTTSLLVLYVLPVVCAVNSSSSACPVTGIVTLVVSSDVILVSDVTGWIGGITAVTGCDSDTDWLVVFSDEISGKVATSGKVMASEIMVTSSGVATSAGVTSIGVVTSVDVATTGGAVTPESVATSKGVATIMDVAMSTGFVALVDAVTSADVATSTDDTSTGVVTSISMSKGVVMST